MSIACESTGMNESETYTETALRAAITVAIMMVGLSGGAVFQNGWLWPVSGVVLGIAAAVLMRLLIERWRPKRATQESD